MEGQQQQRQLPQPPAQPQHQEQPVVPAPDAATVNRPISSVALKLPPYWPNDPILWFTQVEAQFTTRGITVDATKYAYLVGSLQPEIAQEVRDLLLNPPTDNRYVNLKDTLIRRTTDSDQQRLCQLLTAEELGDRKPSQLYRRMLQLLGDRPLESSIMKQLFLSRLPTNVQLILAATKDELDLGSLTSLADKIIEVSVTATAPTSVSAVHTDNTPSLSATLENLQKQIQQLSTQVNSLQSDRRHNRYQSRSTSRHRNRSSGRHSSPAQPNSTNRSAQHSNNTPQLCWYHEKFGVNARKCNPPCSENSNADN
ncbi:uncharacterized protein [Antedon mediterranea]|uniref:uncharacterized protein n=1 Tax=Antedon mediterranea TaxID=105859 RepID=UPI003AF577FC